VIKRFTAVFVGLAALSLVAIPFSGCEGEVSVTTASLSEATMCLGVDSEMRPLDATDVFATDTPEIFCSVKLSHAPDDTEFRAEWIYIKGEEEGLSNYPIAGWDTTADGTRYIAASLTCPDKGWPKGDYKVILYVDAKEKLSVPFSVQ